MCTTYLIKKKKWQALIWPPPCSNSEDLQGAPDPMMKIYDLDG